MTIEYRTETIELDGFSPKALNLLIVSFSAVLIGGIYYLDVHWALSLVATIFILIVAAVIRLGHRGTIGGITRVEKGLISLFSSRTGDLICERLFDGVEIYCTDFRPLEAAEDRIEVLLLLKEPVAGIRNILLFNIWEENGVVQSDCEGTEQQLEKPFDGRLAHDPIKSPHKGDNRVTELAELLTQRLQTETGLEVLYGHK